MNEEMPGREELERLTRPGETKIAPDNVCAFFYVCICISSISSFMCGFSLGFSSPTTVASYRVRMCIHFLKCVWCLWAGNLGHVGRNACAATYAKREHQQTHTCIQIHKHTHPHTHTRTRTHTHTHTHTHTNTQTNAHSHTLALVDSAKTLTPWQASGVSADAAACITYNGTRNVNNSHMLNCELRLSDEMTSWFGR